MNKRLRAVLVFIAAVTGSVLHGEEGDNPKAKTLGPLAGKVDARLLPALNQIRTRAAKNGDAVAAIKSAHKSAIARAEPDQLTIRLDAAVTDELLKQIAATGAKIRHSSPQWNTVTVSATLEQIDTLANTPGIRRVMLEAGARANAGSVQSQADGSMKANQVRTNFNITGRGQKVGVLSDSVNNTSAVGTGVTTGTVPNAILRQTNSQNNGDLTADIQVVDFGPGGGDDEGAGMLDLVHDVAPDAALAFGSAFTSHTKFADNIRLLRTAANCTVITDDVFYFDEPMFQDGPIAQSIIANAAAGVPHFSSAGNQGNGGIAATYVDVNPGSTEAASLTGVDFHNWGIGGGTPSFLPFVVPGGSEVTILLQWNQPFSSFNLGAGSQIDMDLYVCTAANINSRLTGTGGAEFQGTTGQPSGDPAEVLTFTNNNGSATTFFLALDHFRGSTDVFFRIVFLNDVTFPNGGAGAMTTFGHSASADCISVGAIFYGDIDNGGNSGPSDTDPAAINAEDFTSKGGIGAQGVPFYFNTAGAPLAGAPVKRDKPDIAAPDGSNTSTFGDDINFDADTFPNFFGTSAAAPNAAAVAALIKERAPTITPTQLRNLLQGTARDIVASNPVSVTGPDDRTGAGLVDALAAFNAIPKITQQPADITVDAGDTATFVVVASGSGLTFQWQRNGANIPGALSASYTTPETSYVADNGAQFRCVVSNGFASVTSNPGTLTVRSAPIVLTPPANAIVNINTSATFTISVTGTGPFTFQWQRETTDIPGASASSYSTPPVTLADNGVQFRCVVTNSIGQVTSSFAKIVVNTPPNLTSGPTATPNPAMTGQTINFSASATDPEGQALTFAWNFGDGTGGVGAAVTHVYDIEGEYAVTVTVSDPLALNALGQLTVTVLLDTDRDQVPDAEDLDDDNDGVSDLLEIDTGTSPIDANSSPFNGKPSLGTQPLTIKALAIKLNFIGKPTDSVTMTGSLPIPADFLPQGQSVTANVGGVVKVFTLDGKGRSLKDAAGSFAVSFKSRRGVVEAQTGKFTLKIVKQSFSARLVDEDLTSQTVKSAPRTVKATLFFNQTIFQKDQPQLYTATQGKTGKTK